MSIKPLIKWDDIPTGIIIQILGVIIISLILYFKRKFLKGKLSGLRECVSLRCRKWKKLFLDVLEDYHNLSDEFKKLNKDEILDSTIIKNIALDLHFKKEDLSRQLDENNLIEKTQHENDKYFSKFWFYHEKFFFKKETWLVNKIALYILERYGRSNIKGLIFLSRSKSHYNGVLENTDVGRNESFYRNMKYTLTLFKQDIKSPHCESLIEDLKGANVLLIQPISNTDDLLESACNYIQQFGIKIAGIITIFDIFEGFIKPLKFNTLEEQILISLDLKIQDKRNIPAKRKGISMFPK